MTENRTPSSVKALKRTAGSKPGMARSGLGQDLAGDLDGHPLDQGQVAVEGHDDGQEEPHLLLRQVGVGVDGRGQLGVGHDDHVVLGGPDGRVAPGDVADLALLARLQADVVARPDLPGHQDVQPGEEVGERVLQGQGHGQAADAEGREQRRDGDAEVVEDEARSRWR